MDESITLKPSISLTQLPVQVSDVGASLCKYDMLNGDNGNIMAEFPSKLFPALLKYWRVSRGLSQLDLALGADVSARHISFMETGRAQPSKDMILMLASHLQVPLRHQNELLSAAGFEPVFPEPSVEALLESPIGQVLRAMLNLHEPYPMVIMDRAYNLLLSNQAAKAILQSYVAEPSALSDCINMFELLYDPRLIRPYIRNWPSTARHLLSRLHREVLLHPHDQALTKLLERVLAYPDVPVAWKVPDFSELSTGSLGICIEKGETKLNFMTTMTRFSAPQNITLEEILIESYFPISEN